MRTRSSGFWLGVLFWAFSGAVFTALRVSSPDGKALGSLLVPTVLWLVLGGSTSCVLLPLTRRLGASDRVPIVVAGSALATIAGTVLMGGSLLAVGSLLGGAPLEPRSVATVAGVVGSTVLAWSLGALVLGAHERAHERERLRLAAEAEMTRARLGMLRYQLHPHFLFNALNSLATAIDEDSERAQRMLVDLSQLLREALGVDNDDGTLGRELARLQVYLRIERARFEDDLQVATSVPDEILRQDCLPLLLQPLVENAIKHGRDSGGAIDVRLSIERVGDRIRVLVRNRRGPSAAPGWGIGLANTRERLRLRYGPDHLLEKREIDEWVEVETSWPAVTA